jgi:hypothetical protein
MQTYSNHDFRVRELSFRVEREGINSEPDDLSLQKVTGVVHINEPCDAVKVEKMLQARQAGRALQVKLDSGRRQQDIRLDGRGCQALGRPVSSEAFLER